MWRWIMVKRKKMWANRIPVPFPKNDLNFNGYTHKTCMKDNNILIDYVLFYLREMVCDVKYSFSTIILYGTYILYIGIIICVSEDKWHCNAFERKYTPRCHLLFNSFMHNATTLFRPSFFLTFHLRYGVQSHIIHSFVDS